MSADVPRECGPNDVEFTIAWDEITSVRLAGHLTARNVSDRAWQISGKPVLIPVTATERSVHPNHIVTWEAAVPDYVIVKPAQAAIAKISMNGWDGSKRADYVLIDWPGGRAKATVAGPAHPSNISLEPPSSSSHWFRSA